MSAVAYPSAFGNQTLHNGTTHRSVNIIAGSGESAAKYISLPNGTLFDPYGTTAAPIKPSPVTATVFLTYSTQALANTEYEALVALIGTRATLTATKTSGGTMTCTARLKKISNVSPFRDRPGGHMKVKLEFVPLTNWQ